MSVNVENMTTLIAALRSGEYRQATGCLRSVGGGYCCLGVATDKAVKAGVQGVRWELVAIDSNGSAWCAVSDMHEGAVIMYEGAGIREYGVLPWAVMSWLGLEARNPTIDITEPVREAILAADAGHLLVCEKLDTNGVGFIKVPRRSATIAELNDAGVPFSAIADILEEAFLKGDDDNNDEED